MLLDHENLVGLKRTQKVRVKCDRCDCIVDKIVYNLVAQRLKRSEDICKRCATIVYNQTRSEESRFKAGQGFKDKYLGKKLEEIVGDVKAVEMKQKFSIRSSGKNNPNFGGVLTKGFADRPLTGSFESRYGLDKAVEMKTAQSKRNSGEGNPMYGKPAPRKSGNGISGKYRGIYFRSLLELSYMIKLDFEQVEFISCEASRKRFEYELDGVKRTYYPDFFIPSINEYVEVKPSQMLKNREVNVKVDAVRAAGERIKFITQRDMVKIKKDELMKLIEAGTITIDESKLKWL
jgi:hypothetical protein